MYFVCNWAIYLNSKFDQHTESIKVQVIINLQLSPCHIILHMSTGRDGCNLLCALLCGFLFSTLPDVLQLMGHTKMSYIASCNSFVFYKFIIVCHM